MARNHLRTQPDDLAECALQNLKASADQSISKLMEMPRCLQKSTYDPKILDMRARSIAQTVQSLHSDKKQDDGKIRQLTIRYEEREQLLLQEIDNFKRKEASYMQQTESLRKINESLQQELDLVRKIDNGDATSLLVIEQENQSLRAELEELREQLSRSRVMSNSDAYRYRNEALELREHVGKLERELSKLEDRIKVETQSSLAVRERLCSLEKQSAHLVVENCQLRDSLAKAEQQLQSASSLQRDRGEVMELASRLKFMEQENLLLQKQNATITTSFNPMLCNGLLMGRRQPPTKTVTLTTHGNSSTHCRVKTEADSKIFDKPPSRRSFNRNDRQSVRHHTASGSTEKERLNDAIVKRCKLTVGPF